MPRPSLLYPAVIAAACSATRPGPAADGAAAPLTYYRDIQPLLQRSCTGCHGGERPKSGLSLETLDGLRAGGKKGVPLVPGKPAESLLYLLASRERKPFMPPKEEDALGKSDLSIIRAWIETGAAGGEPAPESLPYAVPPRPPIYPRPPPIAALCWSKDGKRLFVGGYREVLLVEPEPDGPAPEPGRFVGEAERIHVLALSPGEKLLAAAGGSPGLFGELQLWDPASGVMKRYVRLGRDTLFAASFSPDGSRIALGGTDRSIRLLETDTLKELYASEIHSDWILGLAFTADGSRIISGGRDRTLKVSGAKDGKLIETLAAWNDPIHTVTARPGSPVVLAAGEGKTPVLFDAEALKESRKLEGQPGAVLASAFSADGKLLAVAGASGEGRIYGVDDGALKAVFRGHTGWVYALAFRPDGERIAVAGYEGTIRIHETREGKEVRSFVPVPIAGAEEKP
jgi:dipeptidyl aminopeptidase/acylaminoacyl peptidase